jgi:hypothetical protein
MDQKTGRRMKVLKCRVQFTHCTKSFTYVDDHRVSQSGTKEEHETTGVYKMQIVTRDDNSGIPNVIES